MNGTGMGEVRDRGGGTEDEGGTNTQGMGRKGDQWGDQISKRRQGIGTDVKHKDRDKDGLRGYG